MRINKILILGILVSSGLGLAFAQPNSSPSARDASNGSAAPAPTGDLTEVLRKKQVELDTAKNKAVAPVSSISTENPSTMIVTAEDAQQSKLMEELHKKQAEQYSTPEQIKAQAKQKAAAEKAARKQAKLEMIARKKVEQREAAKKAKEEMAAKKAKEEVTAKKAKEEMTAKKAKEEVAAKMAKEEMAAKKAKEEVAAKKAKEEMAAKKAKEEMAAKKAKKEVAACKTQEAPCVAVKQVATPQAAVPKAENSKKATVEKAISQPMTRDQKLADLLRRYRADEITPHEYHEGRARIMAEP